MTATLRTRLIKPLPDLSQPAYLPNPAITPENPAKYPGDNYIPNPDDNYKLVDKLFSDAAAWIARLFAETQNYHSDSTVDSHNAMIAVLTDMNNVIYGYDQSMNLPEAVDKWLDDEYAGDDLVETANPNTGISDELNENRPELFSYFNLDWEAFLDDED